jgi:2-polyprenyl-3-methyl-5-hydroxy-6-metoxy-1,4-benzoquinol methylase
MRGKEVLDVGSVGQTERYNLWQEYSNVAYKSLTGIDLPSAETETSEKFAVQRGERDASICYGNMEDYEFNQQFDLIIAGDVIEHVENQGLFLRNAHKHLKPEGKLIITTPNAQWPTVFIPPNPTHTKWHDRYTMKRILTLTGFNIAFFRYYCGNKKSYPLLLRPLLWKQSMLLICTKK